MIVRYTNKPNKETIPHPVAKLKTFDDAAFDTNDKSRLKTGTLTDVWLDDLKRISSLKIDSSVFRESPDWRTFFHPFIIREDKGKLEFVALESEPGIKLLQDAAKQKTKVRYLAPTLPTALPTYIWFL